MTIGKKLMAGFAAVLLVTLALVTSTLYNVGELSGALETATQKTAKKIFMVSALEGQLFRMGSCQRGIIMFSLLKIPDKAQNNKQEFETRAAAVDTLIGQLKPILTTKQGRKSSIHRARLR